jgi:dihydroorotase
MKLLLKHVTIADKTSPFNGQIKDILIDGGFIRKIGEQVDEQHAKIIEGNNLMISPGWVDIFSNFNDPGYEFKETLETGASAAASGGFTHVFILPNTNPTISNKASVEYVVQKSKALPVNILPLGSITKNVEGKELAEIYDMRNSGAVSFTDGLSPIQTPGLFLKALQYVKAFNGVLIQLPLDKSIGKLGLINEGITSTQLGLPGIPAIAEEIIVNRDIELADYTGGKLHITGITTARSLALITEAKRKGINVTCSVTPYHLFFCDEDLIDYNTNLKVDPPLRSKQDMLALRQGVIDGTIDLIATHHLPQDWDNKTCEFEYAKAGMIGLESCFAAINSILPKMKNERLIDLLSNNARDIFSLTKSSIIVDGIADLTIFERNTEYIFTTSCIKSKSKNSPFINKQLKGKVQGIINKEKLYLNE